MIISLKIKVDGFKNIIWIPLNNKIERQRDRETERQRDRETERQRDRETEKQREYIFGTCIWTPILKVFRSGPGPLVRIL